MQRCGRDEREESSKFQAPSSREVPTETPPNRGCASRSSPESSARMKFLQAPGNSHRLRLRQPRFGPIDPLAITRRHFFSSAARGLGVMALGSLLPNTLAALGDEKREGGLPGLPHFAPKAKRVIYLFQSGAPSQMDLFDYKPLLNKLNG